MEQAESGDGAGGVLHDEDRSGEHGIDECAGAVGGGLSVVYGGTYDRSFDAVGQAE